MAFKPCAIMTAILLIFIVISLGQVKLPDFTKDPHNAIDNRTIGYDVTIGKNTYVGIDTTIKYLTAIGPGTMVEDEVVIENDVNTTGRVLIGPRSKIGMDTQLFDAQLDEGVVVGMGVSIIASRIGHHSKIGSHSKITNSVLNEVLVLHHVQLRRTFAASQAHFYPDVIVPEETVIREKTIVIRAPETSRLKRMMWPFQKDQEGWKSIESQYSHISERFLDQCNDALDISGRNCHLDSDDQVRRTNIRRGLIHLFYDYLRSKDVYGQMGLDERSVANEIHFGCREIEKPKPISDNIKRCMIKALAIIENSLLSYERVNQTDFCPFVEEVRNGTRKVIAIDAGCAAQIRPGYQCHGVCRKKFMRFPKVKQRIQRITPDIYNARAKELKLEDNTRVRGFLKLHYTKPLKGKAADAKAGVTKKIEPLKTKAKDVRSEIIENLEHLAALPFFKRKGGKGNKSTE